LEDAHQFTVLLGSAQIVENRQHRLEHIDFTLASRWRAVAFNAAPIIDVLGLQPLQIDGALIELSLQRFFCRFLRRRCRFRIIARSAFFPCCLRGSGLFWCGLGVIGYRWLLRRGVGGLFGHRPVRRFVGPEIRLRHLESSSSSTISASTTSSSSPLVEPPSPAAASAPCSAAAASYMA